MHVWEDDAGGHMIKDKDVDVRRSLKTRDNVKQKKREFAGDFPHAAGSANPTPCAN